jgi:hypothetical protein
MRRLVVICAVVASFVAGLQVHSHAAPPTEPGMMPYTPTRIEWLALELEASFHQDFSSDSPYALHYIAATPNTIFIVVQYRNNAPIGVVDKAIDVAKRLVNAHASSNGWSWVKIEVSRSLQQ